MNYKNLSFYTASTLFLLGAIANPVIAAPSIQLTKTSTDLQGNDISTVSSGESFLYTIQYTCVTPDQGDQCENTIITDPLPPEVEYIGVAEGDGTYDADTRTVTFDLGTLNSVTGTVAIEVRFPAGTTVDNQDIDNIATMTATNTASASVNDNDVITTDVDPAAAEEQWEVKKTQLVPSSGITPVLNDPVVYRVQLCAPGAVPGSLNLENAVLTDTPPLASKFEDASGGGTFNDGNGNGIVDAGDTVTWNIGNVAVTDGCISRTITLSYPDSTFNLSDNINNTVTGEGDLIDGTPFDDTANYGHGFSPPNPGTRNFSKGTTNTPHGNPLPGETFSFQFRPRNGGNVALDSLVISDDELPTSQVEVTRIYTGTYTSNFTGDVEVRYKTNSNPTYTAFTAYATNTNLDVGNQITLAPGDFITGVEFRYTNVPVGFDVKNRPRIFVRADADLAQGETIENCAEQTWTYKTQTGINSNCTRPTVDVPRSVIQITKSDLTNENPYTPGESVQFRLRPELRRNSRRDLENPIVMDLLPQGVNYVPGSWTWQDNSLGLPAPDSFEEIPSYKGTGRTLLRWQWTNSTVTTSNSHKNGDISFEVTVSDGVIQGKLTNDSYVTSNDGPITCRDNNKQRVEDDQAVDLDGDGYTGPSTDNFGNLNDPLCKGSQDITVATLPVLEAKKEVKGQLNTDFAGIGQTVAGGQADYRLTITNIGTVPTTDLVFVDIFPYIGDTSVLDSGQPRGSEWRPNLVGPIEVTIPSATVYYSTDINPCRLNPTNGNDLNWPVGCVNDWSTTAPTDITSVTGVKIDFGSFALNPLTSLIQEWPMRAPVRTPIDLTAWNSFSYTGKRFDRSNPELPSEPPRVGVFIKPTTPAVLGDFAWFDANDNGIQDSDEAGINGVRVELFQPGADGVAGTADDVFVGFSVTGLDFPGDPGYYQFSDLDPGDYFLKFVPPVDNYLTIQDQGGDDALDSDVSQITGTTDIFTLGANDENFTFDAGITTTPPTGLASLGDYVWLDGDEDGVQDTNEVGVNGVLVELFDSNDQLIAATQTGNDPNDNPGFYRFRNLPPDEYYVKFTGPSGYSFTQKDIGGDDTKDSDADSTGKTDNFTLAANDDLRDIDAGLTAQPGVGNYVWIDLNRDGVQQVSEVGLNGATVELFEDGNPTPVDTIVTANDITGNPGHYLFPNVDAGDYYVKFTPPNGYQISLQGLGGDSNTDSDPDPTSGETSVFTLASNNEVKLDIDAGMNEIPPGPGFVGDFVWIDTNENGIQDNGEEGLNGVTVEIWEENGTDPYETTVTDNSFGQPGYYLFSDLPAGNYYLKFQTPSGYLITDQDKGSNDTKDSDADPDTGETIVFPITATSNERGWDMGLFVDPNPPKPPELLLIKRITAINGNSDTIDGQNLSSYNDDPNDPNDNATVNWPKPLDTYLRGGIDGGQVRPGDEIEYTIYFLSSGESDAINVNLCDLVPEYTTFIPTSFNGLTPRDAGGLPGADTGIAMAQDGSTLPIAPTAYLTNAEDGDRGQFYPANTTPATGCSGENSNGAVLVKVGTVPFATGAGSPTNSYGFIRFRAKVK